MQKVSTYQDSGHVNGGTSSNAGSIAASAELGVDATNGELESSALGAGLGFLVRFSSLANHCCV